MRACILCSVVVLVLAAGRASAEQGVAAEGLRVRAVGIQVVAQAYTSAPDTSSPGVSVHHRSDDLMPFGSPKGTSLAILVESREKRIVTFDEENSTLGLFRDDKGTDLRSAVPPEGWAPGTTFEWPEISSDGKALLFQIRSAELPAAGSTRLKAEGVAHLALGTEIKSERQEHVSLEKGSRITAGPVPLEIVQVERLSGSKEGSGQGDEPEKTSESEKPLIEVKTDLDRMVEDVDWMLGLDRPTSLYASEAEPEMTMVLKAEQDISRIASVSFYDDKGQKVQSNIMRWYSSRSAEGQESLWHIALAEKLDVADVVVEFWKELEHKEVRFSVEVGLSL